MAMEEIRDEAGALLLRYDREAHIIEIMARHYDNVQHKYRHRRRLIRIEPGAKPVLLEQPPAIPMTIRSKVP